MSTREVVRSDEDPLSTLALAAQVADTLAQASILEVYQQGGEHLGPPA